MRAAFVALLVAMALAWVGGARTGLGNLGEADDHGLAGATAERARTDSIPSGKPIGDESTESRGERESEDDPQLATPSWVRPNLEIQQFAQQAVHAVDVPSAMRAWLLLANIGARGPPVG